MRAKLEHPFRMLKQPFGCTKVRHRGLAKITAQAVTLYALGNLWMVRRQLIGAAGRVHPIRLQALRGARGAPHTQAQWRRRTLACWACSRFRCIKSPQAALRDALCGPSPSSHMVWRPMKCEKHPAVRTDT